MVLEIIWQTQNVVQMVIFLAFVFLSWSSTFLFLSEEKRWMLLLLLTACVLNEWMDGYKYVCIYMYLFTQSALSIFSLSYTCFAFKAAKNYAKCLTAPHLFKFPSEIFCVTKCHHANTIRATQIHTHKRALIAHIIFSEPHFRRVKMKKIAELTESERLWKREREGEAWTFYHFAN